ncbi:hypothetical protein GGR53DRAFT_480918 [Hypoxylon sp. FL1150]|nr:hypothetical protein GGR53DRAFT_480918 [Hypoxylon sp. FL1150]
MPPILSLPASASASSTSPPVRRMLWEATRDRIAIPLWTEEVGPLLERVQSYLTALLNGHFKSQLLVAVELLGKGAFNRAFLVQVRRDPASPPSSLSSPSPFPSLPCRLVMRLALPILPQIKIASEVSTMRFVRHNTNIPVPKVYMYNATSTNDLGYEWILMEHMSGQPYRKVEASLSQDTKKSFVQKLAEWMDALSRLRFDEIGSIYIQSESDVCVSYGGGAGGDGTVAVSDAKCLPSQFVVGEVACQGYMGDWRLEYKLDRGPFRNTRDFLYSLAQVLSIELQDPRQRARAEFEKPHVGLEQANIEAYANGDSLYHRALAAEYLSQETNEERDGRLAMVVQWRAQLQELLDKSIPTHWPEQGRTITLRQFLEMEPFVSFHTTARHDLLEFTEHEKNESEICELVEKINTRVPSTVLPSKSTAIQHYDMSSGNILVDETGEPTALLDWESQYAVPLNLSWVAYPKVLSETGYDGRPSGEISKGDLKALIGGRRPSLSWVGQENLPLYEHIWNTEELFKVFDERLDELESPWLAVKDQGRDSEGHGDGGLDSLSRYIYARLESM